MNRVQVRELLERYEADAASSGERQLVEAWVLHGATAPFDLSDEALLEDLLAIRARLERDLHLLHGTPVQPQIVKRGMHWMRIAAAATVLIVLGLGIYFYVVNYTNPNNPPVVGHDQQPTTNNDIEPGGNKAILTLADGLQIVLDEATDGQLAEENGVRISKTEDGQIVYDLAGARITDAHQHITYNTIQTPRGGQYQVILPDGSKVWLNAASSLRYPSRFDGKERRVELTGEAFFQISSKYQDASIKTASAHADDDGNNSKIPFIVATATQEVTVLGTEFNINAYEDEPVVKTTLVTGSVEIVNLRSKIVNKLSPGEQALVHNGNTTVDEVDTEQYTAWRYGRMVLSGATLADMVRQLERWYDVRFRIPLAMQLTETAYISISRNEHLSSVLKALEDTYGIQFTIQGKEVIISE